MSLKLPVVIRAEAPDKPEEINDFIKQLLSLINQHILLDKPVERNCKLVLIELITNAIKHAVGFNNIIEIHINEEPVLKIRKIDSGPNLKLDQLISGNEKALRNYSVQKQGNVFQFIFIDHRLEEELNSFPEHFGLEIITKVAENFTYEYDVTSKLNVFTVVICV